MKKFINFIRNSSIFFRLSMIIIIVFIPILSLFFITSNNYRIEKQNSIYTMVNQNNHQTISKINDYINDINNITKIPLTYKQADDTYMGQLYNFTVNNINSYKFQLLNEQIFEEIFAYKNSVNSCYIFNLTGQGDYKVRDAVYQPFNPSSEPWFSECIDAFGKPVLVDTYELPYIVNEKNKPFYVFGVARGIVRVSDASVIGILLVNTKISYFEDICDNMKLTENHRVVILHDDYTIYDTVPENIAKPAEDILLSIPDNTDETMFSLKINNESFLISSVDSDSNDLHVISLIPESELFFEINQLQKRNLVILTIVMTLSLFCLFYTSRQIIVPIRHLSKIMKIAESGDFSTHIQVDRMDEVGMLSVSYNSLLDKINELIHEVYLQKIASSESQFQMLQSQINPHFLYNTLESISMMATINDDETTAEMATELGGLLRYSISNINQPVSLSEEIAQLKKYVSLLERRFRSQYSITINIDARYYSISMPKLILQPILENAIYHGMASVRSDGKIVVSAEKADPHTLLLTVSDNGSGMSEEKVRNLNAYINEKNDLFKGIGMRNVNRRIKLFCGPEYGLTVYSSADKGTTVAVRIRIDIP